MKVRSFEMWIGALIQEEKCDGIIYDVKRTKWCWILQGRKLKQARWETTRSNRDFWHCQTKQEEKSDSYWHYSCRSLTVLSSQKHMTVEHCRDSRDAKNMNLDDPQPEGKARNLALIFLCENFPAVSTITVRVGPQKLVQQVLKFCSVLHSTVRPWPSHMPWEKLNWSLSDERTSSWDRQHQGYNWEQQFQTGPLIQSHRWGEGHLQIQTYRC